MPYLLLTLSTLCWSGNFVLIRAITPLIPPVGFLFWRWVVAVLVLTPFVLPKLRAQWPIIRANLKLFPLFAAPLLLFRSRRPGLWLAGLAAPLALAAAPFALTGRLPLGSLPVYTRWWLFNHGPWEPWERLWTAAWPSHGQDAARLVFWLGAAFLALLLGWVRTGRRRHPFHHHRCWDNDEFMALTGLTEGDDAEPDEREEEDEDPRGRFQSAERLLQRPQQRRKLIAAGDRREVAGVV